MKMKDNNLPVLRKKLLSPFGSTCSRFSALLVLALLQCMWLGRQRDEQKRSYIEHTEPTESSPSHEPSEIDKEQESSNVDSMDLLDSLGVDPRPFSQWNLNLPLPCELAERNWKDDRVQKSRTETGILFVKSPKTGSSTASGVTLRIASRIGARHNVSLCKNRVMHSRAHLMGYNRRDRSKSILWSIVRDPTSRAISEFFHFQVSRKGYNTTDEVFQGFLNDERYLKDFQLKYLTFETNFTEDTDRVKEINRILSNYDFIGVTERMDESLVALQMILGLDTADVMQISAKRSGAYDDGRYGRRCVYIQKSFVSPEMASFFENSSRWNDTIYYDRIFHQAVNRSLDLTIHALGPAKFQENLAKYRKMHAELTAECFPQVRMPCDEHGVRRRDKETDCLYSDMGCGFECTDRVLLGASMVQ